MSNPTEEQVEAAAKALRDDHANRVDTWKVPEWENLPHGFKIEYRGKARAALVAAQGAATQPEAYDHCCQHPKCPGGSLCCCTSEQRLRDCWNQWREEIAGDSRQAFRDGYQTGRNDPAPWPAAPVLSSSTVDELAKLIRRLAVRVHVPDPDGLWSDCYDSEQKEWQSVARAVVEAIGGESRGRSN